RVRMKDVGVPESAPEVRRVPRENPRVEERIAEIGGDVARHARRKRPRERNRQREVQRGSDKRVRTCDARARRGRRSVHVSARSYGNLSSSELSTTEDTEFFAPEA